MKHKKQNAFTLVELIVVITILAILWTIAFISLQWYSKSSRDSSRISDISSMKTSLELFQIDAGKYPVPTEWVDVTYSWAVVWNQGTFWEITFTNVAKLDRIPTDPLTDSVYTYSVTSTRNKYQIWWILEWDPLALNTFETANAWTVEWTALISGTYNWQATKTLTWTTCDMLAVPSIIANDLSETTDVVNLINSWSIAYNWFKNLPNSFKSSKFKHDGWFAFTPNKIVAYSDTGSCAPLLSWSDFIPRVTLLKWLQDAYSGTIVSSDAEIARILNITIDINTPSEEVKNLAWNFVNNNLWGKVVVSTTPSKWCATQPSYSWATFTVWTATSINQPWQSTNENEACYWTCGAWNVLLWEDCVLENCSGTTPDGTAAIANATSTAWWTWNYNVTPGVCTYACNTWYEWNWSSCVVETCKFGTSTFWACNFWS